MGLLSNVQIEKVREDDDYKNEIKQIIKYGSQIKNDLCHMNILENFKNRAINNVKCYNDFK